MQHFYDGQIKRYLTQFMRLMSNFGYKDAKGVVRQIPVRYGDMNRQVAQLMNKNSENIIQTAPFIACYIKGMDFARDRLQDPTFVSRVNIRERAIDDREVINDGYGNMIPNPNYNKEYLNVQGANYTIERLMPTPFNLQFTADIWTTNTDQKLQILEQLLVLFNPSMEIQTNNNFVDWTSLSLIELTGMQFSSRSIPQGLEQDIDIASLNFQSPIWLTTPAKVKKLGIITQIITNMFADPQGTVESGAYDEQGVDYFTGRVSISVSRKTLGNLDLLVLNNTAKLMSEGEGFTRNDQVNPGAKGSAKQVVVNGIPVTNARGIKVVSIAGLKELPPAGSIVKIGGVNYTVVSYTGDLANLTIEIDRPLAEDLGNGSNVFIQTPNYSPDNITVPAKLGGDVNWMTILDMYPGKFKAGLSELRLQKPDGSEIVGRISLDPVDENVMHVTWDEETIYSDTLFDINGLRWDGQGTPPQGWDTTTARGVVNAIINPETYNPRPLDQTSADGYGWPQTNIRYLILEDIQGGANGQQWDLRDETGQVVNTYPGVNAWANRDYTAFTAKANDIIEWDGNKWVRVMTAETTKQLTYTTNDRTGVQYVWDGFSWMKSFEGVYEAGKWRLVL